MPLKFQLVVYKNGEERQSAKGDRYPLGAIFDIVPISLTPRYLPLRARVAPTRSASHTTRPHKFSTGADCSLFSLCHFLIALPKYVS